MKDTDGTQVMFESWVRDYASDLYRCALRLCGQPEVAEELVQEVFYEAWRSIDSLRERTKARVWLLSILRHRYMHWLRDRKRHPHSGGPETQSRAESLVSSADLPLDILARQESLQQALNALEDRYKVPFLLVFLEGMTCQETADFLEMPLGTVLSRIHRARLFLRAKLAQETMKNTRDSEEMHLRIPRRESGGGPPAAAGGAGGMA